MRKQALFRLGWDLKKRAKGYQDRPDGRAAPRKRRFIGSENHRATIHPNGVVSATTAAIQTSTEPA
jgi:hypothetical protein